MGTKQFTNSEMRDHFCESRGCSGGRSTPTVWDSWEKERTVLVREVGRVIQKLQQSAMSILLVEQNLQFALKHTDYIHVLGRGQTAHSSLPKDLE